MPRNTKPATPDTFPTTFNDDVQETINRLAAVYGEAPEAFLLRLLSEAADSAADVLRLELLDPLQLSFQAHEKRTQERLMSGTPMALRPKSAKQ